MAQLQLAFDKAAETKNKKIALNSDLKAILADNLEYQEVTEKLTVLSERKKQILQQVADDYPDLINQLATLKMHEQNDKEMLSDLAINQLVSGETVEVKDKDDNLLQPIFSVKFKKV